MKSRTCFLSLLGMLCVMFVAADPALGQIGIRKGGRGTKQTTRREPRTVWQEAGNHRSRVLKFETEVSGDEGEFIGTIKIKPIEKKSRTVSLLLRESDELRITVGGYTVTVDELEELPWKGLYCTTSWRFGPPIDLEDDSGEDVKKPRRQKRELQSLTFDLLNVEGTIHSVEEDIIILKVKPKNGKNWPDIEAKRILNPKYFGNRTTKRVAQRKIKLKILDDVSKFLAGNGAPLDLMDFEDEQKIEATIIYGTRMGLMVKLVAPDVEGELEDDGGRRGKTTPRRTTRRRGVRI